MSLNLGIGTALCRSHVTALNTLMMGGLLGGLCTGGCKNKDLLLFLDVNWEKLVAPLHCD